MADSTRIGVITDRQIITEGQMQAIRRFMLFGNLLTDEIVLTAGGGWYIRNRDLKEVVDG